MKRPPSFRFLKLGWTCVGRFCWMAALFVVFLLGQIDDCVANAADKPVVLVKATETELFTGESLEYFIEVRNIQEPAPPDLAAFEADFDVVSQGDESRNQSSTLIINGRVSQQVTLSHLYRYRLTPRRAGELTIPAPITTVDGVEIKGDPVRISVREPEAQDIVIISQQADPVTVYPTQAFDLTLQILVRPLPDDKSKNPLAPLRQQPPRVDVAWVDLPKGLSGEDKTKWLQPLLSGDGVGFSLNDVTQRGGGFFDNPRAALFQLQQGRWKEPDLQGVEVNYHRYLLKRRVIAASSGTYRFAPALVKGTFVTSREGRSYAGERLVAVSNPLVVTVKDVPSQRPANFTGGIGRYRLAVSASPTTLRVGDPLTLSLEFGQLSGGGPLDLVSAPDLATIPELNDNFEVVDRAPVGRMVGEAKRFEYALRPKRAGVQIPPLVVSVFDPVAEQFVELASEGISLTVSDTDRVSAGDLVGGSGAPANRELRSQDRGIFQNNTTRTDWSNEQPQLATLVGTTVVSWGMVALLGFLRRFTTQYQNDGIGRRRRGARGAAQNRLSEARELVSDNNAPLAIQKIQFALLGILADVENRPPAGLTSSDLIAALENHGASPNDQQATIALFRELESAQYGGGTAASLGELINHAERLVPIILRALQG